MALLYAATAKFLVDAYEYIDSGLATTVHFLYPIFVSIVMIMFYKEKKSIALLVASILSLVGVGMMCIHGEASPSLITGLVLSALTIFTYGLYIVGLNKSRISEMNFDSLTFYVLLMGCLIFLFYCLFTTGIQTVPLTSDWINLILLGVFATFISDLCLVLAVKHAGSTVTSILGSMEPVVAVLVGTLFFAEHFDWMSAIGLLFVLGAVTLVIIANQKK
ncbi:permease of the drug/metabolite transporter (DMT) superfamily [Myroides odoratimimus]|nr:permease of the drug/metabolite transporter (DMT) superfamily [Myroides odoratimimus]